MRVPSPLLAGAVCVPRTSQERSNCRPRTSSRRGMRLHLIFERAASRSCQHRRLERAGDPHRGPGVAQGPIACRPSRPKLSARRPGAVSAQTLTRVCQLAFPDLPHGHSTVPMCTSTCSASRLSWSPSMATSHQRSGFPTYTPGANMVGWEIRFLTNLLRGWAPPDCVGIELNIHAGGDRQHDAEPAAERSNSMQRPQQVPSSSRQRSG